MDHSSFVYLMGPAGEFRSAYGPRTTADVMAKRMRTTIETDEAKKLGTKATP